MKACDPAQVKGDDTIKVKATWQTPLTYLPQQAELTMTVDALLATDKAQLTKGKAIIAYAEALKASTVDALKAAHAQVIAANAGGDGQGAHRDQGAPREAPAVSA